MQPYINITINVLLKNSNDNPSLRISYESAKNKNTIDIIDTKNNKNTSLQNCLKLFGFTKEEEFIDDFIDSISNIYKSSDATIVDISDAIEESIENFNPKIDKLYELEFYMFEEYMDEKLTNKYFSFINHRLASDYYLKV